MATIINAATASFSAATYEKYADQMFFMQVEHKAKHGGNRVAIQKDVDDMIRHEVDQDTKEVMAKFKRTVELRKQMEGMDIVSEIRKALNVK